MDHIKYYLMDEMMDLQIALVMDEKIEFLKDNKMTNLIENMIKSWMVN